MAELKRGIIAGISGHSMSGLWELHFEDGSSCHIESGHGVRQLASAFDAHAGSGDLFKKIKGQEIFYSVDWLGVLEGFTPVAEADEELIEQFETGQTKLDEFIEG